VTRVAVLGAIPRAAQIGCEYALGGCSVVWVDRDGEHVRQLVEEALRLAAQHGLAGPAELERARALMSYGEAGSERLTLIVEVLPEQLASKAEAIARLARPHPEALVASASATIGVTAIGEAAEVAERMLATRYQDPPLLIEVVEVLAAQDTPPRLVGRVSQLLRAIGKRPVALAREAPGLVTGRLEVALLRECLALLEAGVLSPARLDELVSQGIARSWRAIGPLATAAQLGTEELRARIDAIEPTLAGAIVSMRVTEELAADTERVAAERERRDTQLAVALREERAAAPRSREDGSPRES
jgi:5-formyl-3-hydroxy-2-methylpyridine 4-carboxylic acid 5-dehydrogenase